MVLGLAPKSRPLAPGAYSLVVGPAAQSTSGVATGHASVTDFIVAPQLSLWERLSVGGQAYDVWVATSGTGEPVRDDQYLVPGAGGSVLTSGASWRSTRRTHRGVW